MASIGLYACATTSNEGTLAELQQIEADTEDVYLDDGLERAADSYRRYLEETTESARTPEAMRRLADLQIEQAYGVMGTGEFVELEAPDSASQADLPAPEIAADTGDGDTEQQSTGSLAPTESERDFEQRATGRQELLTGSAELDAQLPGSENEPVPGGPLEAIATYQKILADYPNYERNDKVLYQMSRAYDEIGEPDQAMEVMDRLVAKYPYSKFVDEVHFRRGEYFFVRKKYLDAESAYGSIIDMGSTSSYYELALYKLGWTLYKQEFYEEALHNYVAMLGFRKSIGYDFDRDFEEIDEHRVVDTFRVISLSFSNLGGPEIVDEFFSENGHRSYADKIYGNLGEFYFSKLRYDDAASVYKSFIRLNPFHKISPYFGMRVVEIYGEAGFPILVVESKKEFATDYAFNSAYWDYFEVDKAPEVVGFLKTNLTDLAGHYHALYQEEALVEEQAANFDEAHRWYRQFLSSFPADEESPQINYQLADLLLENENFGDAATEYELTAYEYPEHEQASAAGYAAVYAHRENLKLATGARQLEVKMLTVTSSLRFADTFVLHEQAPVVLGAAADDLYEMKDFSLAIESADKLIERYPATDTALIRSAWAVIAYSSMDTAEYQNSEHAYMNVLNLTPDDDETRESVVDGLAAAIYKQGEQSNLLEDYRAAANHFLRIKELAPTSSIRTSAEYDAAAALMKLQDWSMASGVLEEFRVTHPEHELGTEATKQLAFIYREDGQIERSAVEHERIAAEATDPELGREALLTAAELYDEASVVDEAIRVYERYVTEYPRPIDIAMQTRMRMADIFKDELDYVRYHDQLREIVAVDQDAGADRTDRSRYLASQAALVLAELSYEQFARVVLVQPFEESLAEKQLRMDEALQTYESLVGYEVAEVTAAATFYIAEIYLNFSAALLNSERPSGLTDAEMVDYELVIEEEAYPFEEQAIDVHVANFELLAGGIYNPWVQKSLDKLAILMPGRYAKNEISSGFVGSIDTYAYRMPIVPEVELDEEGQVRLPENAEELGITETPTQVSVELE
jgi:tetratricopeptide (TPR) repeat protein